MSTQTENLISVKGLTSEYMVVLVLEAGQTWPEMLSELFLALLCHWYSVLSLEEHCTHVGTHSRPSIDITVCALRWTEPIPCITQAWALRIQHLVNIDAVGKLYSTLLGGSQEAPLFFLPINKACQNKADWCPSCLTLGIDSCGKVWKH